MKNVKGRQRWLFPAGLALFLSFNLACGLTQGLDFLNREEPPATADLSGSGSSDEAATIDEAAAGSFPEENEAQPAPEEESPAPSASAEAQAPLATAKPDRPTALADDQLFIFPGAEPPTMDPHLSGDATSAEYVVEIYSGLMAIDNKLHLIPDLAESYDVSADGLVYTFTLREDAVFRDGKSITAADFKWSFERACDPATESPTADTYLGDIVGCRAKLQGEADEVEGVVVVDDRTLELTIDEPKGFFLAKMTYPTAYVLDRKNVEGNPDWATNQPNGSGPFVLEEFALDEGIIVLTRNDNYYREPKPTLERVIYLINVPVIPLTGYEDGLASLGLPEGVTYDAIPVSVSELSRVTDPNDPLSQEFVAAPELNVSYIGFNVNQPPFDDPKVRQAFNLALDKRRMVRLVFQDTVPVANGIVPPTMPDYENPDLSDYEYDPERALELIAESSYGDVSELPEITLNVSGSGGSVGGLIEAIVESYKQNLGVEVMVEQAPWPEFLADLNQPDPPYQMYQLGWIADYPDPQNFLEVLFHSNSAQNHGNYSNPEVDALLDQARRTSDPDERLELYQQAEQMILDDAAWVPLYFGVENWLVKPYIYGFTIPPLKIPKLQYISVGER
ncbi:MAG TPA: ABC transporter substrate-binding protein [Anaerolineae bacterium]|nr:ABC transporter substrate-binding protein [Anaerolineae bacterium]